MSMFRVCVDKDEIIEFPWDSIYCPSVSTYVYRIPDRLVPGADIKIKKQIN